MAPSDRFTAPAPTCGPRAGTAGADRHAPEPPEADPTEHRRVSGERPTSEERRVSGVRRPSGATDGWREAAPHDVRLVVVSGAATVELGDGTRAPLVAGDVYGVPPGAAHRATARQQPCEILRIDPSGAACSELLP